MTGDVTRFAEELTALREENARLLVELTAERAKSAMLAKAIRRYRGVAIPLTNALNSIDLTEWAEAPPSPQGPIGYTVEGTFITGAPTAAAAE